MGPGRWLISLVNRQIVKSTADCGLAAKGRQLERAEGGEEVVVVYGGCRREQGGNVKEVPQASARVTFEPIFSRASDYIIPLVGIKLGFGTVRRSDLRFFAASRTTLHLRSRRTVFALSGCLISTIRRAVVLRFQSKSISIGMHVLLNSQKAQRNKDACQYDAFHVWSISISRPLRLIKERH